MTANQVKKFFLLMIALIVLVYPMRGVAEDKDVYPAGESYEVDENSEHDLSHNVSKFSYGSASAGKLFLRGNINSQTTYGTNKVQAYGVNDKLTFGYSYAGNYKKTDDTKWHLIDDKAKNVAGIALKKSVQSGVVIIRKSSDGKNWEDACEPLYDFFDKNKTGKSDIYTTTEDDIKAGTYYRVCIAYEMTRKTGEKDDFWHTAIMDTKRCTEVYTIYICSDRNDIVIKDIENRGILQDGATVKKGFYLDMNGSRASVSIEKKGSAPVTAGIGSYRCDKGSYTVNITTMLGQTYKKKIDISDGTALTMVKPKVYEPTGQSDSGP